jgi:predicted PhzF superfamily epimerase YddE/YHI9
MDQIEGIHTRVFAADSSGGNPCPVIRPADSLDDNEMLALLVALDWIPCSF